MPMTGAQRVEKHRQRQKARIAELERELAETRQESANRLWQAADLVEKVANLQKSNRRAWTMYKNERDANGLPDLLGEPKPPVSAVPWNELKAMSPEQLQAWVKVGCTLARQGHDDPGGNATRWVEGNVGVALDAGVGQLPDRR